MNETPTEYEVKFFPINLNKMRKKLQDAGASLKTPERLMRRCVFAAGANSGMTYTYEKIKTGTEYKALITGIAELFKLGDPSYHILVDLARGNSNCIFEALVTLCERLDELDIEAIVESR